MVVKVLYLYIVISDLFVMVDLVVKMVEDGCEMIGVLGVDFMFENVRVIIDEVGYADVKVYCMVVEDIGCLFVEVV